jgi:hypothetical protein
MKQWSRFVEALNNPHTTLREYYYFARPSTGTRIGRLEIFQELGWLQAYEIFSNAHGLAQFVPRPTLDSITAKRDSHRSAAQYHFRNSPAELTLLRIFPMTRPLYIEAIKAHILG